jgi:hypothetical protein
MVVPSLQACSTVLPFGITSGLTKIGKTSSFKQDTASDQAQAQVVSAVNAVNDQS